MSFSLTQKTQLRSVISSVLEDFVDPAQNKKTVLVHVVADGFNYPRCATVKFHLCYDAKQELLE